MKGQPFIHCGDEHPKAGPRPCFRKVNQSFASWLGLDLNFRNHRVQEDESLHPLNTLYTAGARIDSGWTK